MVKQILGMVGLTLFMLWSCTINEPEPPVWDTSWQIDLPVKDVTLKEIVNDSTILADTINGQPVMSFKMEDSTDWEKIQESDLTVTPENDQFEAQIGTIKLEPKSELKSPDIPLDQILPPDLLAKDTIPPYPATTVTPEPREITYDFFERAVITRGQLYLVFHNELFVKIDPGLKIEVYNNLTNPVLIATIIFNEPIEPYSTAKSNVIDLSGLEIYNQFRLKFTIPVAGSDTFQVVTDEQKQGALYSVMTLENIEVSEADAKVPEQTFDKDKTMSLPQEDHRIINAHIKSGKITLHISNNLPIHSSTEIIFPDILKDGTPEKIELELQPKQFVTKVVDLADFVIQNSTSPGEPLDSIQIKTTSVVSSNDQIVTIKESDKISVDVSFSDIVLASVTGIIKPVTVSISPTEIDNSDLFEKIEGTGFVLDDLQLKIKIENQIDIPVQLSLTLTAQNGTTEKVMHINETILAASQAPFTEIVLDKNYKTPNSIVELFSIFPQKISISGQASVEGQGTVALGQGVRALFSVETPLFFKLLHPISYQSGLDSIIDIDQDIRDRLANDFHQGSFNLLIKNGTPFGTEFSFILADDSTAVDTKTIIDSTRKIVITVNIKSGQIGSDGFVAMPTQNLVKINLNEQQMKLFQKSPIYFKQMATILPTDDQLVKLRTSDTIELEGSVKVNFTVRINN